MHVYHTKLHYIDIYVLLMPSSLEFRFSLQLVLRNGEQLYLVVQVNIRLDTAGVNAGTENVGYATAKVDRLKYIVVTHAS